MAQKANEPHQCNLLELRERFQLTQKGLGDILGVTVRTICNYETGVITLPIDKAIFLCQKYNCTLEWLYCYPANAKVVDGFSGKMKDYPKFLVDIRDFLSYCGNSVNFTIPNYYWEYIKKRNAIVSSRTPDGEKTRKIAELNGAYETQENEQQYWRFSIKAEEFLSYLRFDSKFVPFADASGSSAEKPSEEQMKEATSFLELLMDVNDDM